MQEPQAAQPTTKSLQHHCTNCHEFPAAVLWSIPKGMATSVLTVCNFAHVWLQHMHSCSIQCVLAVIRAPVVLGPGSWAT